MPNGGPGKSKVVGNRKGVAPLLTANDFYGLDHRLIYGAIAALVAAGAPVDVVTVHEQLRSGDHAEACGGLPYLNDLAQGVPSAANVLHYAEIVRNHAVLRKQIAGATRIGEAARAHGADPARVQALAHELLADVGASALAPADLFHVIDMATLAGHEDADAQAWWYWAGYIPAGHVTLLGGHGGAGKSILALHLAACIAMGVECFGKPTARTRVLYFTAEDPASLVLHRLRLICRHLGFPRDEVAQWLQVLDASDLDPVLFAERRIEGVKLGVTTPAYHALADYVEGEDFGVVVIDNASDTFDGDEISRPMVRAFIRSLATLVRSRDGALLLLAHVDKSTSRAGKQGGGEAYSGSTAWHNSARSRLFLLETEPGQLEVQHQKCNLGPKQPVVRLEWPEGGVMQAVQAGGFVAAIEAKNDMKALLALMHEFHGRGEFIACGVTSPRNAARMLVSEKQYPRNLKRQDAFALLRDAERQGLLGKVTYQDENRKPRERWELTPAGLAFIGVAPTAPTAPT